MACRSTDRLVTYFIQRGEDGPIKIGRTSNVDARLRALATGSAEPLRLLATIDGNHETALHAKLAEHRRQGEWFAPAPPVLAEVARATAPPPLLATPAPPAEAPRPAPPVPKGKRWIPARRPEPAGSLAHDVKRRVIAASLGK